MLKKLLLVLSIVVLLSACGKNESKVKGMQVTLENLAEVAEKVKQDQSITKEEVDLLNSSINYYAPLKDSLKNKTVGDLITAERTRQNDVSRETLSNNLNRIEFNSSIAVAFDNMEKVQEAGKDILVATYRFQNTAKTDIKLLKGFLDFFNQQGVIVKRYEIIIDKDIPAGKILTVRYPYGYDDNNERDKAIVANWKDYPRVWKPTLAEFKNGKKLAMKQN